MRHTCFRYGLCTSSGGTSWAGVYVEIEMHIGGMCARARAHMCVRCVGSNDGGYAQCDACAHIAFRPVVCDSSEGCAGACACADAHFPSAQVTLGQLLQLAPLNPSAFWYFPGSQAWHACFTSACPFPQVSSHTAGRLPRNTKVAVSYRTKTRVPHT